MHSRGQNDPILHIQYIYLYIIFVSGNLYQTIINYLYVAYSFKTSFHISIMVKKVGVKMTPCCKFGWKNIVRPRVKQLKFGLNFVW